MFLCFLACSASQAEELSQLRRRESRTIGSTSRQKHRGEAQGSRERNGGGGWWAVEGGQKGSTAVCLLHRHREDIGKAYSASC